MTVDEQETDSAQSRGRGQTPQEQGAIATDDQREMAVLQERRDRVSNAGDERAEALRIDDVGPRVARR